MSTEKQLPLISTTTIGSYSKGLLMEVMGENEEKRKVGMSYDDVLTLVKEKYPEGNTSKKSLQWYNSDLKKEGKEVPIRCKESLLHLRE